MGCLRRELDVQVAGGLRHELGVGGSQFTERGVAGDRGEREGEDVRREDDVDDVQDADVDDGQEGLVRVGR
jgi:hypothetical protein